MSYQFEQSALDVGYEPFHVVVHEQDLSRDLGDWAGDKFASPAADPSSAAAIPVQDYEPGRHREDDTLTSNGSAGAPSTAARIGDGPGKEYVRLLLVASCGAVLSGLGTVSYYGFKWWWGWAWSRDLAEHEQRLVGVLGNTCIGSIVGAVAATLILVSLRILSRVHNRLRG